MFQASYEQTPKHTWYFGEGLTPGEEFTYEICDFVLRIPESPDHCYTITINFIVLLPSQEDNVWIVSAHVNHRIRTVDMIFQISASSFKIKTDGTNAPYAESVERTLGWVKQFANWNRPQVLSVGKSWGEVLGDATSAEIAISQIDSLEFKSSLEQTYLLSYALIKDSYLHIKDDFPFPLKASIYRPVSSHQNIPLAFTFVLTDHQSDNFNVCYILPIPSKASRIEPSQDKVRQEFTDLLLEEPDAYLQNQNNTDIEIFTIDELLGPTGENSTIHLLLKEAYGDNYKQKLQQAIHNFTRFTEMISKATSATLETR